MESNMDVKQDCKPVSMVKMVTEIVSIFKFEKTARVLSAPGGVD